jgi:hypothetical protein
MHAGGHLRDAFVDWVEDDCPDEIPAEGQVTFCDGQPRTADRLIGQLWHCSDIMPVDLCGELDMPQGTTYASAVQQLAPRN